MYILFHDTLKGRMEQIMAEVAITIPVFSTKVAAKVAQVAIATPFLLVLLQYRTLQTYTPSIL